MTPGDSAASEASVLWSPQATDLAVLDELATLWALWDLCGRTVEALPHRNILRRALWAEAWLAASEGRAPRLPAAHAAWFYADTPDVGCGVDVFA